MEFIFDYFEWYQALIQYIFALIVQACYFLISFVALLVKSILSIPRVFSFLPSELSVVLIGLFSVVVLYKIMGRE